MSERIRKKSIYLVIMLFMSLLCFACFSNKIFAEDKTNVTRVENDKEQNLQGILLGDSYGMGWNPDTHEYVPNSWSHLVSENFNKQYMTIGKGGIGFTSGESFTDLLTEKTEKLENKEGIKNIVVVSGYNDNVYNSTKIKEGITNFVNKAKALFPNAKISIGMVAANNKDATIQQRIENVVLPSYQEAARENNIYYITNIQYSLRLGDESYFFSDGIHPNEKGQNEIAQYVINHLQAIDESNSNVQKVVQLYRNQNASDSEYEKLNVTDGDKIGFDQINFTNGTKKIIGWSYRNVNSKVYSAEDINSDDFLNNLGQLTKLYAIWGADQDKVGLEKINNELYYFENGEINKDYKGIFKDGEDIYYINNGKVDSSFTGFAEDEDETWYYFKNGKVDLDYTNLVLDQGTWYYVVNGKIDWDADTLAQVNGEGTWYKVTGGRVDWDYTGLTNFYGTWYYIISGRLDWDYSNLVEYYGTWYYVHNGQIDWNYSTLSQVDGGGTWYKVTDGKLDWNYTGLTEYYGTWYYIENGRLNWGYHNLVNYNGTWFYVNGGRIDWNYSNLVEYYGTWYYVSNGKIDWSSSTLAQVDGNGTWYQVNNAKIDWNYTGLTNFYGTWYYINHGRLNWQYNGLVEYNGEWFYVNHGRITWADSGAVEHNGTYYYVDNSKIRWNYNGETTINGKSYKVHNSIIDYDFFPQANAVLNQIGRNLQAAYNWSASLTYWRQNYSPDMGTRWYADIGFNQHRGNCYVMAATFTEMARALGYDAHQVVGYVPHRGGGDAPHSWVEIDEADGTWVYDPNFTNEKGLPAFHFKYGQSRTWRYYNFHRTRLN